jgi:hypothetical protein
MTQYRTYRREIENFSANTDYRLEGRNGNWALVNRPECEPIQVMATGQTLNELRLNMYSSGLHCPVVIRVTDEMLDDYLCATPLEVYRNHDNHWALVNHSVDSDADVTVERSARDMLNYLYDLAPSCPVQYETEEVLTDPYSGISLVFIGGQLSTVTAGSVVNTFSGVYEPLTCNISVASTSQNGALVEVPALESSTESHGSLTAQFDGVNFGRIFGNVLPVDGDGNPYWVVADDLEPGWYPTNEYSGYDGW